MNNFSPVRKSDVIIGKPLPWPIYDGNRKLLLRAGFVVESYAQVQRLLDAGLFREMTGEFDDFTKWVPDLSVDEQAQGVGSASAVHGSQKSLFSEIRIPIGTAVQLTNLENEAGGREIVRLIGYFDRKSLMVSHPSRDGNIMFVKEGVAYRCRAFAGKNAYAFDSNVLRVALTPYPYLHLSFPATIHTSVIRKTARIPVEIIATVTPEISAKVMTCALKDLSVEGALIQTKSAIADPGANVRLAFRLMIDEEPSLFEIDAQVRSIHPASATEPGVMRYGVMFRALDLAVRREMEIYIYRQMISDA